MTRYCAGVVGLSGSLKFITKYLATPHESHTDEFGIDHGIFKVECERRAQLVVLFRQKHVLV